MEDDLQKYPIYFDRSLQQMYIIEWFDTGNNEIPKKIYLNRGVMYQDGTQTYDEKEGRKRR